jgi:hypothetical protein
MMIPLYSDYYYLKMRDSKHNYKAHNKKRKKTNKSRMRNHKRNFKIKS